MRNSDEKRRMILDNASKLFSQKGYFGVGINEILQLCHIPKGSFYHYFPNGKNQLAVEVIYYAYQMMEDGIKENIFSFSNDAVEVFQKMANHLAQAIEQKKEGFASLLITFMGIESVYVSEEVNLASKEVYYRWEMLYKEKLIECGYSCEKAAEYSKLLLTLIHGNLIACWIRKDATNLYNVVRRLPNILK